MGAVTAVGAAKPVFALGAPSIHVVKDPGCPGCNGWIGHLRDNGLAARIEERSLQAVGLSVPGMVAPSGSPGRGPEPEREAYDVIMTQKDGSAMHCTIYPAA